MRKIGDKHAINKGLQRATGEIIAYLNSDDYYLPGALHHVAEYFSANPDVDLLHGRCRKVDVIGNKNGETFGSITTYAEILDLWDVWWQKRNFVQPEVFWTKRITDRIGPFREDLYWVMDYDYWARVLRAGGRVGRLDAELACFRVQPNQKSTQPERTAEELLAVVRPLIWEKTDMISPRTRRELKGKWIFDALFRREAARVAANGYGRGRRWLILAWLSLRHPQVFVARSFRERLTTALSGNKCRFVQ